MILYINVRFISLYEIIINGKYFEYRAVGKKHKHNYDKNDMNLTFT